MLTKQEAIACVDKIQQYAMDNGRKQETWYFYHNHIYGVALIAQKIAQKLGLDSERAFVLGLLHDCGKLYEEKQQRFHGIIGYEMMKDIDEKIALVALNHSYFYHKIEPYDEIKDRYFYNKKDYDLTCRLIENQPYDDYDLLIQFCDALANRDGFVTIEKRISEFLSRHPEGLPSFQQKYIMTLKQYFVDKLGCNPYDLFDEISHDDFIDETYIYQPKNLD